MNVIRGPYATTPGAVPDANRCPTCGAYHPVASLARDHCRDTDNDATDGAA